MARRLDKIENDLGYLELMAEKTRRLRKKARFIQVDLELLNQLEAECTPQHEPPEVSGSDDRDDAASRIWRRGFFAAALLEKIREERTMLDRDLEGIGHKLQALTDGDPTEDIQGSLRNEKSRVFKRLSPRHSSMLRSLAGDLKKVDEEWNALGEDLLNLDEGLFFLERNQDYLKSCRADLIAARNGLDPDTWCKSDRLQHLFRHTILGRAVEMALGADRALRLAQKELVCVGGAKLPTDGFRRILLSLLGTLFSDLYSERQIRNSVLRIEEVKAANLRLLDAVKARRAELGERYEKMEGARNRMFTKLGAAGKAIQ